MRVVGFRAFEAADVHGGELRSWAFFRVWQIGVNAASCDHPGCSGPPALHPVATALAGGRPQRIGCGFHAFAHLVALEHYLDAQRQRPPLLRPPMCAVVGGLGTVQLCGHGWRARRAEILALFGDSPLEHRLAERYGVMLLPVPATADLGRVERFAGEWGLTHGEALRLP